MRSKVWSFDLQTEFIPLRMDLIYIEPNQFCAHIYTFR